MAGPEPRDSYNPLQSVTPTLAAPSDTLQTRANPNQMGAQLGEALKGTGDQLQKSQDQYLDYKMQVQGLANEHEATMADMDYAVKTGDVYNKYRSLTGLAASNAKDQAVSDISQIYKQVGEGMSNQASRKAYEALATRRLTFSIQDINSYAAEQQKSAYKNGRVATMNNTLNDTNKYEVASDPKQFGYALGSLDFDIASLYTDPGYGMYPDAKATQNKDGTLTFDQSTDEGKIAQSDYDNFRAVQVGKAWENRITALATDPVHGNINTAVEEFEKNKDQIPPASRASLGARLSSPYKSEQARSGVEGLLGNAHQNYVNELGGTDVSKAFLDQESGDGKTSQNIGQIQPDTFKEFAKPGEDINNPDDNRAVTQRILDKYKTDYNGDLARVATAYFSGPGNVSASGDQPYINDYQDKNGKSVSSYVSDIQGRVTNSPAATYKTPADYMSQHEPELIQQARDLAKDRGLDTTGQDLFAQRMEARINEMKSAQAGESRALSDDIISRVSNAQNPIKNMEMLDNSSDPEVRKNWVQLQALNPYARVTVQNLVAANARGKSNTYGTDFYNHLQSVLKGEVTDPTTLGDYVGGDKSPISAAGFGTLSDEAEHAGTPEGKAFATAESAFLKTLHSQFTGAGQIPGISDQASTTKFNQVVQEVLPKIQAGRAAGKTAAELFTPGSKDYVQTAVKPPTLNELFSSIPFNTLGEQSTDITSYKTLTDLQKAVTDKKVSRQDAIKYALTQKDQNGKPWIQQAIVPPQVPLPK